MPAPIIKALEVVGYSDWRVGLSGVTKIEAAARNIGGMQTAFWQIFKGADVYAEIYNASAIVYYI